MQNKQTTRIITIVVIIALIALGAYFIFGAKNSSQQQATEAPIVNDNNAAASSTATEEGTSGLTAVGISVGDQNPGRIVVVSQVYINNPAWVVIRENSNGTGGNILGARLFKKGNNSGIIELLNSTKIGKSYIAEVHSDNGDASFDLKTDLPLKDQTGKIVMTTFNVSQGSDSPTQ